MPKGNGSDFSTAYIDFNINLKDKIDPTITRINQFKRAYQTLFFDKPQNISFKFPPPVLLQGIDGNLHYNGFDDYAINNLKFGTGSSNCGSFSDFIKNAKEYKKGNEQISKWNFINLSFPIANFTESGYTQSFEFFISSQQKSTYTLGNNDIVIDIFNLLTSDKSNIANITFYLFDNPLRLKIRISKKVFVQVVVNGQLYKGTPSNGSSNTFTYSGCFGIENNSNNPFKFTLIPSN